MLLCSIQDKDFMIRVPVDLTWAPSLQSSSASVAELAGELHDTCLYGQGLGCFLIGRVASKGRRFQWEEKRTNFPSRACSEYIHPPHLSKKMVFTCPRRCLVRCLLPPVHPPGTNEA